MGNFSQELENTNENFKEALDVEFNEWEAIFLQCLNEAQLDRAFNENLDPKLVGSFLINSWHGAILRMKPTSNTKPLEDFKAFVFEQLLN